LKRFDGKAFSQLFWSPTGQFIVLAGLKSSNHALEFMDTSDYSITATTEHFMATDVEWDPTGRFVVTANSYWIHRADNSFWFWSFQGRLLRKVPMDGFCQLFWRPRPPTLLSDKKIEEIKKTLKKYSPQFEVKDRLALTRVSEEILQKRRELMAAYEAFKAENASRLKAIETQKARLRQGKDDLSNEEVEEETIEFFTKEVITVVEE
jgi:translation initiation factor 3 subunit B